MRQRRIASRPRARRTHRRRLFAVVATGWLLSGLSIAIALGMHPPV